MLKSSFNKSDFRKLTLTVGDDAISSSTAFITNKLYYCNSLLYGLSDFQIQSLKKHWCAYCYEKSKRDSHIIPILKHLHWLPVHFRIRFKILVLTFQAYHGVAPAYLCELITKHHVVRALRSSDMMLLDEPKIRGKTYGIPGYLYHFILSSHIYYTRIEYLCIVYWTVLSIYA